MESRCCPHYIGLSKKTKNIYVTGGVMKADVVHKLARDLGTTIAFVGLTGVGNTNQWLRALEELKQLGIAKLTIAVDMDFSKNDNVRIARGKIIEHARAAGFAVQPLNWIPLTKELMTFCLLRRLMDEKNQPRL